MLDDFQAKAEKVINHFKDELRQIRTGRAQPALVEGVVVEVESYGGAKMRLQDLATISAPEASLLLVQPFDPSVIKDIERALHAANLGLSPATDQQVIRLVMPPLTSERRQQMIKLVAQKVEETRIAIRNLRTQIKEEIESQADEGGVSEDDIKRQVEQLQNEVDKLNEQIEQLKVEKEAELTTV